jgi:dTMP kinase
MSNHALLKVTWRFQASLERMTTRAGSLIAFEGIDQSGKETQARRVRERMSAAGRPAEIIAFPDRDTPIGQEIERALRGGRDYPADVMQLLYVANRYEWRPAIERSLEAGHVVICDRYLASSVAYGEAQGLDPRWLFDLQRLLPQPDLTVLLDIAPEVAADRKRANRDRYESDMSLLERVRASYLRQAAAPGWHVIDGARPADAVEGDVGRAVDRELALP